MPKSFLKMDTTQPGRIWAPRGPKGPHGAPRGPKGPQGAPWGPKGAQGGPRGPLGGFPYWFRGGGYLWGMVPEQNRNSHFHWDLASLAKP